MNYVSFPDLKDYFEVAARKCRSRGMDGSTSGLYSLKALCKAISLQFASDVEGSLSLTRSEKGEAKHRADEGDGFRASEFFNELTRTLDEKGWATTEFLEEGKDGRTEGLVPSQARRASSMPARNLYDSNRYSSGELHENKTLMVLDGIDTFFHPKSPLFTPTLSFLNELLRYPSISILATSTVKLAPLIDKFDSASNTLANSEEKGLPLLRRHHTSIAAVKDVVEKNVPLQPLNQFNSAVMLIHVMSRTLNLDEMKSSAVEGMELAKITREQVRERDRRHPQGTQCFH